MSSNQFEAGEAQQELLAAGCLEGYCGSGVDAASLHLFHYSQTDAIFWPGWMGCSREADGLEEAAVAPVPAGGVVSLLMPALEREEGCGWEEEAGDEKLRVGVSLRDCSPSLAGICPLAGLPIGLDEGQDCGRAVLA